MVKTKLQLPRIIRVLIVDDEELMAEYLSDLLLSVDCETTVFLDSQAALEFIKPQLNDYDLVVSDISMPVLNGERLAEEILNIRPDMPVVLCSGYEPRTDKHELLNMGVKDFMPKPIDSSKLLQIVNELKMS